MNKKDLIKLYETEAILKEFHEWYKNILSCAKNKKTIIVSELDDEVLKFY